ncbi:hypothetical protein HELRODRAFT_82549 [Helobdella robusta]|uniref:Roadblock/LAMTOR2 domain-containing protein n=1 Tax=Helobdella robusta TaxID=6412 RepID=T1G4T7_HELRO|nr:hypothetical protein HELRODRAFT_82549 [Helobdella robusta]ESO00836.1 hypothetical protein HELRODRAFT_82549 [Helobdella robusta]
MSSVIFKPKVLTQVLSSANSDGVLCTLLLSGDGSLMAYTGYDSKNARDIAAIANNIWMHLSKNLKFTSDLDELDSVLINCQEGNVIVSRVANFLLCSYSNKDVELGLLRSKAQALVSFLQEPMKSVVAATS